MASAQLKDLLFRMSETVRWCRITDGQLTLRILLIRTAGMSGVPGPPRSFLTSLARWRGEVGHECEPETSLAWVAVDKSPTRTQSARGMVLGLPTIWPVLASYLRATGETVHFYGLPTSRQVGSLRASRAARESANPFGENIQVLGIGTTSSRGQHMRTITSFTIRAPGWHPPGGGFLAHLSEMRE